MTRFKLGNTENYIDVSIVYKVKEDLEKQEIFIVTPDLLKSYGLPASKFISFLQQNLTFEDPYYSICHELWSSNKGLFSKTCAKESNQFELNKITQIISEKTGVIDLETK
jgi:hypothetical protein